MPWPTITLALSLLRATKWNTSFPTYPTLEPCICLTIVSVAVNSKSPLQRGTKSCQDLLSQLFVGIEQIHAWESITRAESECSLWLSLFAATSASWCSDVALEAKGANLMDRILEEFHIARTWASLEAVMRKFLWYPHLAEEWKQCWEEGMIRRQDRG